LIWDNGLLIELSGELFLFMKYISTRGDKTLRGFSDILLEGLAPDGGLYLPMHYPRINSTTLKHWRSLSYSELAFEIMSLYIDDIPPNDLRTLTARAYTKQIFGTDNIVPLKPISAGFSLLALSNGPTLAFKDIAMQMLGQLFEYELGRRGIQLNILGATSGDTGSAAEYAMRGKKGISVFMLSPQGRMSAFQQAQMFSLQDKNIHNLTIEGVFDDCQDIVKAVSSDLEFKRQYAIGTVNSINWARLLAQVVYYFAGYLQACPDETSLVDFAVPSGNFGNICAGHVARMMGLPIRRLVLATNENNVLDEFFRTGIYRVRTSAETLETSSPSMDISKASNFERFVFDLLKRDSLRTQTLFTTHLNESGTFELTAAELAELPAFGFVTGRSTHTDRLQTIRQIWDQAQILIDPHTADGVKVARNFQDADIPMLVLETALPAKFAITIEEAIGFAPPVPPGLKDIEHLPRRVTLIPPDVQSVKNYIHQQVVGIA
jgi:threonine synthase